MDNFCFQLIYWCLKAKNLYWIKCMTNVWPTTFELWSVTVLIIGVNFSSLYFECIYLHIRWRFGDSSSWQQRDAIRHEWEIGGCFWYSAVTAKIHSYFSRRRRCLIKCHEERERKRRSMCFNWVESANIGFCNKNLMTIRF